MRSHSTARSQRLRPVLRQLQEPDHPVERELAQPDRRAQPADRARLDRPAWASGSSRRSTSGARDFPGRRWTSSRTSSARATGSGRLPTVSTLDFTLARPWRFRKYRFTAGIKIYNAFNTGNERDVQTNITSPDYGRFYNPDSALDWVRRGHDSTVAEFSIPTLGRRSLSRCLRLSTAPAAGRERHDDATTRRQRQDHEDHEEPRKESCESLRRILPAGGAALRAVAGVRVG